MLGLSVEKNVLRHFSRKKVINIIVTTYRVHFKLGSRTESQDEVSDKSANNNRFKFYISIVLMSVRMEYQSIKCAIRLINFLSLIYSIH